jgi:hypothetical protein
MVVLHRPNQKNKVPLLELARSVLFHQRPLANQKNKVPLLELVAYALALGILIGTAYVSWLKCGG